MTYLETPAGYLLRFHPGEDVVQGIVAFARRHRVEAAWVHGLGAFQSAEIGYYVLEERRYERHTIDEDVELAPLVGNLSWLGDDPIPHLHVNLGRRDFSAVAGHLFAARAGATVEIWLGTLPGARLERRADERVGLNLLALPKEFAPDRS